MYVVFKYSKEFLSKERSMNAVDKISAVSVCLPVDCHVVVSLFVDNDLIHKYNLLYDNTVM